MTKPNVQIKLAYPGFFLTVTDNETGVENSWAITIDELKEIIDKGEEALELLSQEILKETT